MKIINDKVLWEHCVEGDSMACERLYTLYYNSLLTFGLRLAKESIVHDVIQDLFVCILQGEIKEKDIDSIDAYLFGVFRNKLYDRLREECSTKRYVKIEFIEDETCDLLAMNAEDTNTRSLIKNCLKLLPNRQREVITLFYQKNNSHKEISKILNIKEQSSKNLLSKAITNLREQVLEYSTL